MRTRSGLRRAAFAALVLLAACGGEAGGSAAASVEAAGGGESSPAPEATLDLFQVDGRGSSGETSSTLQVVEGERDVILTVRGADAMGSLLLIYVFIEGVENVIGSHRLEIGSSDSARASAAGSVDGRDYFSLGGELELDIAADRQLDGRFQITLATDAGGAPAAGEAAAVADQVTISGSFQNHWSVTCRSPIRGFTGGHAVGDSPYCTSLDL